MSGYGNALVSGNSTFTYAEKNEISFKSSLGRIMTDLKKNWNEEPISNIIRDPITVLKKNIPSYEKIKHYYLVDPMIGETSNGPMVTNVTVETAINTWASSKLDTIINTDIVRDNDDLHWQLSVELNETNQNKNFYQLNKLSRNMFAKYVYWKKGLTGSLTNDTQYVPNGPTNDPIQYVSNNSNNSYKTGTYPSTTAPFNSFLNLTPGNNNNSYNHGHPNQFRTYSQIVAGVKLKEEAQERGDTIYENPHSRLYTFLKTVYAPIEIIAPNDRHDITKKHPYIKLNLCVPTIPTWDPSIINNDNSNNIITNTEQIDNNQSTQSQIGTLPFSFIIVYNDTDNCYKVIYDHILTNNYRNVFIDDTREWKFILKSTENYGKDFGFYRDEQHTQPFTFGVSSEGIIGVPGSGTNGTGPYVTIDLSLGLETITPVKNIQALTGFTHQTSSSSAATSSSQLFDNSNNTYWSSVHSTGYHTWPHKYTGNTNIGPYYGEYVKITFPELTTVTKISLNALSTGINCPKDFIILGSEDNSHWLVLKQYEGLNLANYFDVADDGSISNRHPFFAILNQPETYKYFAIIIQAIDNNYGTDSSTTGFVGISEIDLYGPTIANFPITNPIEQETITIPTEYVKELDTQDKLLTGEANHTITASSSEDNTTLPFNLFDNIILQQPPTYVENTGIYETIQEKSWTTKESYDVNGNYSSFNNEVFTTGSNSDAVVGEWVQVDLKKKAQVNKLSLNVYFDVSNTYVIAGENSPKDFSLFASNDNINWSKINSWTDLSNVNYYDDVNEEFNTLELHITETNKYQFWRLVVNKITGGTSLQLSELKLHGFYEETNFLVTNDGTKFSSSSTGTSQYSNSYTHSNAFNGSTTSGDWLSSGGSYDTDGTYLLTQRQFDNYKGEWLQSDMSEPKKVYFFKIYPRSSISQQGASAPSSFRLYGSLNNSNWYPIKDWNSLTSTDYYSGGNYTPFIAKLDEPVSYRYYRLVINKATTLTGLITSYVAICELEYYGNEYISYIPPTKLYYGTSNPSEGGIVYINEGTGPSLITDKISSLEKISGQCNGQTIYTSTGEYTLENVTGSQELSTSYQNVNGSKINYIPPKNVTQVIYNFNALIAYREITNNYGTNRTILEKIGGQCRGQSLTTSYGSTTLTNVTGTWSPNNSYNIITGSQINYRPPPGTTELKYKFKFQTSYIDADYIFHYRLYVDNTEVTDFRTTYRDNSHGEEVVDLEFTFRIGQGNNYAYGMWNDWSSNKTIDVRVREYSGDYEGRFHTTQHWDGAGTDQFRPPQLELEAIGPLTTLIDPHPISHWRLYVDNQEVTSFRRTFSAKNIEQTTDFKFIFEIGNGNDIANGKFDTWDELKEIKLMAREFGGNNEVKLFQTYNFDGYVSSQLVKPLLEIETLGPLAPYLLDESVLNSVVNTTNELTTEVNSAKDRITALETKVEQDILNIFTGNENNNRVTDNIGFWNPLMEMGLGENQNYARGFYKYAENSNVLGWSKLEKGNWSEIPVNAFENSSIFYNYAGIFMCYGIKKVYNRPVIDGVTDGSFNTFVGFDFMDEELSISWCPQMTFLSYAGETLEDNIINSGSSFPDGKRWEDDLFINTTDNILYRYDITGDTWKAIGITPEIDNLELKITANEGGIRSLQGSVTQINSQQNLVLNHDIRLSVLESDTADFKNITGNIQLIETNNEIIIAENNTQTNRLNNIDATLVNHKNNLDTHTTQINQINIRNTSIEQTNKLINEELLVVESRLDETDISWVTLSSNDVIVDLNLELNILDLSLNTLRFDHILLQNLTTNIGSHPNIQSDSLLLTDVDLSLNVVLAKLLTVNLVLEEYNTTIVDISSSLGLKMNQLSSVVGTFENTITDNSTKITGLTGDIDDMVLDIDDIKQDSVLTKQELTTTNVDIFNLQNKADDTTIDVSENALRIEILDNSFNILKNIPIKILNLQLQHDEQDAINTEFDLDLQALEGRSNYNDTKFENIEERITDISARLLNTTHYHSGDFIVDISENGINKIYIPNTASLFYIDTDHTELDTSSNPHEGKKLYIINASTTTSTGFIVNPNKTGYFIYTGEYDLPNGVNAPIGWIRVFQADT